MTYLNGQKQRDGLFWWMLLFNRIVRQNVNVGAFTGGFYGVPSRIFREGEGDRGWCKSCLRHNPVIGELCQTLMLEMDVI